MLLLKLLFVSLVYSTSALRTCDKQIIERIKQINGCPPQGQVIPAILASFGRAGSIRFAVDPDVVPPAAQTRCVSAKLLPGNGYTLATVYYHHYTGTCTKIFYTQVETGCGEIIETEVSNNKQYKIYSLSTSNGFCYYRCTDYTTVGGHMVVFAQPVDRQDASVQWAESDCISKLEAVGLPTPSPLNYINTCPLGFRDPNC